MDAPTLVDRFLAALNGADWAAALDLVIEDVVFDPPTGDRQIGREALRWWFAGRRRQGRETFHDIAVMSSPDGTRAAAEFTLKQEGAAGAAGDRASVNAGMFFAISAGRIERVTCCNFPA